MRHSRRILIILSVAVVAALLGPAQRVFAHANLIEAHPPANAVLGEAPPEISLIFTEPLEARFSRIILRGADGAIIETPPSRIDPADPHRMILAPGELPEGLYTVVWRALSAADGHATEGSYPIAIGAALSRGAVVNAVESVPLEGVVVRTLNFVSLALGVGSIAFMLFVWRPIEASAAFAPRHWRLIWVGWALVSAAGVLGLLLQVSTAAGVSLAAALTDPALGEVIAGTRYGTLFISRMLLWAALAVALWIARRWRPGLWFALGLGAALPLMTSLHSHASATEDPAAAIIGDWLHLLFVALWVGGLVQFALTLTALLRLPKDQRASPAARLTALFSNYARVCVGVIAVSGVYAAWLHVGSLEGLLTTLYGRALLGKMTAFAPLLGIAGLNLLLTSRRLRAGAAVWVGRLRGLVMAEIALAALVLIMTGMMTSGAPARSVIAQRHATPQQPNAQPYFEMQIAGGMMAHLEFTPGWVGENTFTVSLLDAADGQTLITDASLIRLRFESVDANIPQSELRPELQANGTYQVSAANLSAPGRWRIRMTVQRPGQFDTVVDFRPRISPAPEPLPAVIDNSIPADARTLAAVLAGLGLVAIGVLALSRGRPKDARETSAAFVALALLIGGAGIAISAAQAFALL